MLDLSSAALGDGVVRNYSNSESAVYGGKGFNFSGSFKSIESDPIESTIGSIGSWFCIGPLVHWFGSVAKRLSATDCAGCFLFQ